MITLYQLTGCPFCARVEDTLDELGISYETREVPSARQKRTQVKEISGQAGVPVIVDPENDVEGMAESADIVAYLETHYGE